MKKGRSRGEKAGPPPPPRREPGRAAAAGGGRREPQDARAPGAACGEAKEKAASFETSIGTAAGHGFLSSCPFSLGDIFMD